MIPEITLALRSLPVIRSILKKIGIGIDQGITPVGPGDFIRWRIINKTGSNFNLSLIKIMDLSSEKAHTTFACCDLPKLLQPAESYDLTLSKKMQDVIKYDTDSFGDMLVFDVSGNKFRMKDEEKQKFIALLTR